MIAKSIYRIEGEHYRDGEPRYFIRVKRKCMEKPVTATVTSLDEAKEVVKLLYAKYPTETERRIAKMKEEAC